MLRLPIILPPGHFPEADLKGVAADGSVANPDRLAHAQNPPPICPAFDDGARKRGVDDFLALYR